MTGIGGVGKSTFAALIHRHAEEQRRLGSSPFTAEALWLRIDPAVTITDLVGTIFEALDKPQLDFGSLTPQNLAVALFNALNTTERSRLLVLDQFENLLDTQTGYALADHAGVGEWLDALNSQPCRCRVLLTSRLWPQGTREYPPTYMQEYHSRGMEIAEGIELLRKQEVVATEAEVRMAVEHCTGHAFALTLLASLEQSLQICKGLDRWGEGKTLNNLGQVYVGMGQKELALEYLGRALTIRREVGDHGGEATTLNDLGKLYADLGQQEQALKCYQQALKIRRNTDDREGEGTTLHNLGVFYFKVEPPIPRAEASSRPY